MKNFKPLFFGMMLHALLIPASMAQAGFASTNAQSLDYLEATKRVDPIPKWSLANALHLSKDNPTCIGNVNLDHSFTMTTQSSLGISNGHALTFGFTYKCADYHSGQKIPTEAIAFDVYWGASQFGPWYLVESFLNDNLQLGQKHLCPAFQPKAGVSLFIKVVATVNTLNNSVVDSWVVLDDLVLAPNQGEDVPIEPFAVQSKQKKHKIRLEWASNAKHYAYFSIERATDHTDFKHIGKVCSGKRSNGLSAYAFEDQKLSVGKRYYYRVKYYDFYEHYQYSRVIEVSVTKRNRAMPQINPFEGLQAYGFQ
jgi:hypothetical protein